MPVAVHVKLLEHGRHRELRRSGRAVHRHRFQETQRGDDDGVAPPNPLVVLEYATDGEDKEVVVSVRFFHHHVEYPRVANRGEALERGGAILRETMQVASADDAASALDTQHRGAIGAIVDGPPHVDLNG